MKTLFAWFRASYFVKPEFMGGEMHHMIYWRKFGASLFLERWNTAGAADIRLRELQSQ
jgi:hypothetical protein